MWIRKSEKEISEQSTKRGFLFGLAAIVEGILGPGIGPTPWWSNTVLCPKCSSAKFADEQNQCSCGGRFEKASNLKWVDEAGKSSKRAIAVEKSKWVSVFTPIDMNQVVFIKSLLQSENVPYVIEGDNLNTLSAPLRIVPMRVMVPNAHAKRMRELLKDIG